MQKANSVVGSFWPESLCARCTLYCLAKTRRLGLGVAILFGYILKLPFVVGQLFWLVYAWQQEMPANVKFVKCSTKPQC